MKKTLIAIGINAVLTLGAVVLHYQLATIICGLLLLNSLRLAVVKKRNERNTL